MRLSDRIHLVGSGSFGFDLSDPFDCHVYLLDGGEELALVDVGAGMGAEAIIDKVRRQQLDPARIRHLILTHAHGDHAGGAARMRRLLEAPAVYLSRERAQAIRTGDEHVVSIDVAKRVGIYPESYTLEPCEVDVELAEGDTIAVGDLTLRVLETPGHADGHISLLLEHSGRRSLFAGDAIFHGGKILLQAIHDCRLDAQIATLRKLRDLRIDALFPGHLAFSLEDGQRHVERANAVLDRLLIPEQMVSAW
jgi:glyoxylase-like metal-dependent hydrolase (beta-lactamase superfamily II)